MNRVEDLDVFKLAHELALKIYSTAGFAVHFKWNLPGTALRLRPRYPNTSAPVAIA
jgi:hypothetical protein